LTFLEQKKKILLLFICAYNACVISPPCPHPLPYHPPSRYPAGTILPLSLIYTLKEHRSDDLFLPTKPCFLNMPIRLWIHHWVNPVMSSEPSMVQLLLKGPISKHCCSGEQAFNRELLRHISDPNRNNQGHGYKVLT
jgi:hypothetical protein